MKFNKKELICFIVSIVGTAAVFFTAGAFTADFLELNRIDTTVIEYTPQTAPTASAKTSGENISTENTTVTSLEDFSDSKTNGSFTAITNSETDNTSTNSTYISTTTPQSSPSNSPVDTNSISKTIVIPSVTSSTSRTTSTARTIYINTTTTQNITKTSQPQTQSSSTTTTAVPVGKINLNTATKEELMTVKGIGEVYASRIIEYREQIGYFTCIEELLEVKGIGEKRLAQWAPYLTV